jgi:hypothetical protein
MSAKIPHEPSKETARNIFSQATLSPAMTTSNTMGTINNPTRIKK